MLVKIANIKYKVDREDVDEAFTVESVETLLPDVIKTEVNEATKEAVAEAIVKITGFEADSFEYTVYEDRIHDIDVYAEWLQKSDNFVMNK